QPGGEPAHVGPGLGAGRVGQRGGGDAGGAGAEDGGAHGVARQGGALGGADEPPVGLVGLVGVGVGDGDGVGGVDQPGAGEQPGGVDVAGQDAVDLGEVADAGEVVGQPAGGEVAELEVDGGELDVGGAVVGLLGEVVVLGQDGADLLELGAADLLDALADRLGGQAGLARRRQREVDAGVEE